MSVGGDSMEKDEDSEASLSDDEYIMAPVDKQKEKPDDTMEDEDDTRYLAENGQQLNHVKDWISAYHLDNLGVTDVLSNFPDISMRSEYEFDDVKVESDDHSALGKKSPPTMLEGQMYMKALFHALPMDYITIPKLQSKLGGEVKQTMVHNLMDKMTKDGFIETSSNRWLNLIHF